MVHSGGRPQRHPTTDHRLDSGQLRDAGDVRPDAVGDIHVEQHPLRYRCARLLSFPPLMLAVDRSRLQWYLLRGDGRAYGGSWSSRLRSRTVEYLRRGDGARWLYQPHAKRRREWKHEFFSRSASPPSAASFAHDHTISVTALRRRVLPRGVGAAAIDADRNGACIA